VEPRAAEHRDPAIAAVLSAIVPGAGLLYAGSPRAAAVLLVSEAILYALGWWIALMPLHLWQIALAAGTSAAFPAAKYPSLFLFYSVPNMGKTVAENEEAIYGILERLKTEKVDEETLQRVKTKVRAGVIRQLASNAGLASTLTFYHVNYGDWRMLFKAIDVIGAVTADDVQRVVKEYFTAKNRTVAYHVKPPAETPDTKENAE